MKKNLNLRKIKVILIIILLNLFVISTLIFTISCSSNKSKGTETSIAAGSQQNQNGQNSQGSSASNSSELSTSSTSTSKQQTTTTQQIPPDIAQMISEADNYYNNGQYAEAVSAYRKIKPAVESNSNLSDDMKNQIINSYSKNFDDAKTITETARMHYGNAMQLEYEKRIQEAVKELEEALKVYPKYQDAIDKLDSIKSLYKLK
ncbi:MAG: hypothetical protein M1326_02400 [Cyanobacteria bacterium]|nr:hypothetical protein [Cyanobacteriota bacterium]